MSNGEFFQDQDSKTSLCVIIFNIRDIMATITGQATDPVSPGVLGQPMNIDLPGTFAIGVEGDGGNGFPGPAGVPGRIAIGVRGTTSDPNGAGVQGENKAGGRGVFG
jgi:hypothetical protein